MATKRTISSGTDEEVNSLTESINQLSTTTPSSSTEDERNESASLFLSLPGELRNAIYADIARDATTTSTSNWIENIALARTSRQARAEYLPILMGNGNFTVPVERVSSFVEVVHNMGLEDNTLSGTLNLDIDEIWLWFPPYLEINILPALKLHRRHPNLDIVVVQSGNRYPIWDMQAYQYFVNACMKWPADAFQWIRSISLGNNGTIQLVVNRGMEYGVRVWVSVWEGTEQWRDVVQHISVQEVRA